MPKRVIQYGPAGPLVRAGAMFADRPYAALAKSEDAARTDKQNNGEEAAFLNDAERCKEGKKSKVKQGIAIEAS